MCELLAEPFGERVQVSSIEAEPRATSRTYDTLVLLKERYPDLELALAVGSDILSEVAEWYRWAEIEAMVPVVVLARPGYLSERATPVSMPDVASTEIRRRLVVGESVVGLLPVSVAEYIKRRGLYGA